MTQRIVLGTMNPSKLEEMKSYFTGTELVPVTPLELLLHPTIPETADTVEGNAILKARAWHRASGLPVIAEDSGLVFLDLPSDHPDQPGRLVRRFQGRSMRDEEMLEHYQAVIHRNGGELRACWRNCWCLLQDETHGEIHQNSSVPFLLLESASPSRRTGWPLDSITWLPEAGKYLVDCSEDEKCYRDLKGGYKDAFHTWILGASVRLIRRQMNQLE